MSAGLSPADWLILAILLLSAVRAAFRGIFVEAFALAGIVAGVGIASWNYGRLAPLFAQWVRTTAVADAAAFLSIALGVMIAAGLLGRLVRWMVRSVGLGWADRLLGAIFGLLRGAVLVVVGVMALIAFQPGSGWLAGSRLAPYFAAVARGTAVGTPAGLRDRVIYGARLLSEHLHTPMPWERAR